MKGGAPMALGPNGGHRIAIDIELVHTSDFGCRRSPKPQVPEISSYDDKTVEVGVYRKMSCLQSEWLKLSGRDRKWS